MRKNSFWANGGFGTIIVTNYIGDGDRFPLLLRDEWSILVDGGREMRKKRKWWLVPVILSAVLGFMPIQLCVINLLYVIRFSANRGILDAYGTGITASLVAKRIERIESGLFLLFFILVAIWIPTGIVMGIRKRKKHPISISSSGSE